jgi:hypothetical protein
MGVIYKLTDDVVRFILEYKQSRPDISLRELVDIVAVQFQKEVSKSSIHDVLRHANISSPRGRKFKSKFQIPAEKKAQLFGRPIPEDEPTVSLTQVETPPLVNPEEQSAPTQESEHVSLLPDPVVSLVCLPILSSPSVSVGDLVPEQLALDARQKHSGMTLEGANAPLVQDAQEPLKPLVRKEGRENLQEFLLKAAFGDLFPKPWGEVKSHLDLKSFDPNSLQKEWAYRSLLVSAFKVELEDECCFYVDARFQGLSGEWSSMFPLAPIERGLSDMAEILLNNLEPIILRGFNESHPNACFYDFLRAMDGMPGKNITKICLLNPQGEPVAEFGGILHHQRTFILGLQAQQEGPSLEKLESFQTTASHLYPHPLRFAAREFLAGRTAYRSFIVLDSQDVPQTTLVTNMPSSVADKTIVRLYMERHPHGAALVYPNQTPQAISPLEYLKDYIGQVFLQSSSFEWDSLAAIEGEIEFNDRVAIFSLTDPRLHPAADMINALHIKDDHGRRLWIKSKLD